MSYLQSFDVDILLFINKHHSPFFDQVMWFASAKVTWIPFYLFLVILIAVKLKKRAIPLLLLIALLILCSDQLASGILKPLVHRLRPSHQPGVMELLHYVRGYHGGPYGFVSSHAANSFSLSFYFLFTLRKKIPWLAYVMFSWAALLCYSRLYLGVHYPTDIIVPFLFSIPLAWLISRLYFTIAEKYFPLKNKAL